MTVKDIAPWFHLTGIVTWPLASTLVRERSKQLQIGMVESVDSGYAIKLVANNLTPPALH